MTDLNSDNKTNVADTVKYITDNIVDALNVTSATRTFDRNIIANIVLDNDGDIATIDFIFSEDGTYGNATVEQGIVKSISSTGIVRKIGGSTFFGGKEIEDVEEELDPRVIKNNELVSLEDIEAGDVLTIISVNGTVSVVYISDDRAEGTVSRIKNQTITVDSEAYNSVKALKGNSDGDIEEIGSIADLTTYFDEDVELYLNFMGEIVAMVATTNATDLTVGLVVRDGAERTDDNDVTYVSVKILTNDGSKSTYKVYNKNAKKDYDDETWMQTITDENNDFKAGTVVVFAADSNRKIASDKIEILTISDADSANAPVANDSATKKYSIDSKDDVLVLSLPEKLPDTVSTQGYYFTVNNEKNTITIAEYKTDKSIVDGTSKTYRYGTATTGYNIKSDKLEIIKSWDSLCSSSNCYFDEDQKLVVDGAKIQYFVGEVATYAQVENNYAVLVDVAVDKDEDDNKIYVATLYVDGKEVKYELADATVDDAVAEGDFVKYTLEDDIIKTMTAYIAVNKIADIKLTDALVSGTDPLVNGIATTVIKESLTVKEVDDGYIYFVDNLTTSLGAPIDAVSELVLDEDGYIIYDLRNDSQSMIDDINDIVDTLVYGYKSESDGDIDILVVIQ